jgi:dipeptidyl aminopeptidase/acylaminoacyl peptidase
MLEDVRSTAEYAEVTALYTALLRPGEGHVYAAPEAQATADGAQAILVGMRFAGTLEQGPGSALYVTALGTGDDGLTLLADGAGGRLPRPHPTGSGLAWIVAGTDGGDRLLIADTLDGARRSIAIDGLVEELAWSPDGASLLLVVAGLGADLAGYQGGFATATIKAGPDWLPAVHTTAQANLWRRLWRYDLAAGALRCVSADGTNVWEASWCGDDVAVIATDDHSEGSWYDATLRLIAADGSERTLYTPTDSIGLPTAARDGRGIAFVEAVASDRGLICGTAKWIDLASGAVTALDAGEVEVTSLTWSGDDRLLYAGQRGDLTRVGLIDPAGGAASTLWESRDLTCGEWYPRAFALGRDQALMSVENYHNPPRLATVAADGALTIAHDFAAPGAADLAADTVVETVRWTAPDGLTIEGVMIRPATPAGPAPLVLDIHGGPVWANRNRWMVRTRTTPLLVRRGYCVLFPNPRGSATYGQDFARAVKGDMGGADTGDFLAALDHFTASGLADPKRLACTGSSYGGFMSSWLIGQDLRFAAAAPISPVTDWRTQHFTSQIPYFDEIFLEGAVFDPDGRHETRSPLRFVDRVRTPTLLLAGALDKNTPPAHALAFYTGLIEQGVETALVTYPRDGHSLRGYPAYPDTAARILLWFERHLNKAGSLAA